MYLCATLSDPDSWGRVDCTEWIEYTGDGAGTTQTASEWEQLTYDDVTLLAAAALGIYATAWVIRQVLHFIRTNY